LLATKGLLAGAVLLLATAAAAQTVDVHAGRVIDPAQAKVLTDQRSASSTARSRR
jgi:hypothetical protein